MLYQLLLNYRSKKQMCDMKETNELRTDAFIILSFNILKIDSAKYK